MYVLTETYTTADPRETSFGSKQPFPPLDLPLVWWSRRFAIICVRLQAVTDVCALPCLREAALPAALSRSLQRICRRVFACALAIACEAFTR